MENKRDIGTFFKNKLNTLDKTPSDNLWNKIEQNLDNKRKKRRFLFWLFPSLLITGLLITSLFLNQNQEKTSQAKPQLEQKESKKMHTVVVSNNLSSSSEITTIKKTRTEKLMNQSQKLIHSTTEYEEYEVVKKYKVIIKKNKVITKTNQNKIRKSIIKSGNYTHKKWNKNKAKKATKTVMPKKHLDSLETKTEFQKTFTDSENARNQKKSDSIKKDSTINAKPKRKPIEKREYKPDSTSLNEIKVDPEYYITIFYGPTFFGSLANKSMLNDAFNNLSKNHPISSCYGFTFRTMYNKIGFRAGFSKINLEISNSLNSSDLIPNYVNINLNNTVSIVAIYQNFAGANKIKLFQNFLYYEIPIEFYYSIKEYDNKIGIDIFSGFSVMILGKNSLTLSSDKIRNFEIGSTSSISKMNISYNLGLGLNYKLSEKIQIDCNPIFKYYLSSFNDNNNPKPYSFSIQSGITYKF